MAERCRVEENRRACACTYNACSNRGICCRCVASHRDRGEIPGCFFPPEWEKKYDRSRAAFLRAWRAAE